jgi:hypothetical protein
MRYEVTICRPLRSRKKHIRTKANSLREVKSLVSGVKTRTPDVHDILIKCLKTGAYITLNQLKVWMRHDLGYRYTRQQKLAKGIYKSGFIKA